MSVLRGVPRAALRARKPLRAPTPLRDSVPRRAQSFARLAAACAAGAALNLAFAPFGWWPLAILTPAILFALIGGLPPRRAFGAGAAFGTGLFGCGTYWLYTCLHTYGLVPVWLTLLLQAVVIAVLSAFPALSCYVANRVWLKSGAARSWLVLPVLWVLFEWLRGWVLTGFPWLSLGYAMIDSPLKGFAPLFGIYGLTFAVAAMAAALDALQLPGAPMPRRLWALAVIVILIAIPAALSRHAWTRSEGAPLPVAAVQGAVSQDQKWQENNRDETLKRYRQLTEQAWGARLIVWPESALPVLAVDIPEYLQALKESGRAHGADFAIGLVNYDAASGQYHNGVLVLSGAGGANGAGGAGGGWYYKRHLVPFGEYFPVPAFVRSWMRLMNLPYDDITPGAAHQPRLRAAGQTLGITICYEDAFGQEQLASLRDSTLLVNVTNNAWYGDSTAPHQHLEIARMRALEAGRYLVRAANDGITAVIGPHGEIVARLPQFAQAVLRADVQPMTGLTPYARLGNYPVVLAAGLMLGAAVWRRRRGGHA